jgi:hypothetical protein
MRAFTVRLTILGLGAALGGTAQAGPLWATELDPSRLSAVARAQWDMAVGAWDKVDYHGGLRHLELVAQNRPDLPQVWFALATAAEDLATRHSGTDALDHLRVADRALQRLNAFPSLPREIEARLPYLMRAVASEEMTQMELVGALTDEPLSLDALRHRLVSLPSARSRGGEEFAGSAWGTAPGSGFYARTPDWRNGNYNVLARRQAERVMAGHRGQPINIQLRAGVLDRRDPGARQGRVVGFGSPGDPPIVNPRFNSNWSVRYRDTAGSGVSSRTFARPPLGRLSQ